MIFYLRHGETTWNRAQRLQGRLDSPLTLRGVQMAMDYGHWLAQELAGREGVRVHTSPMGRARQTAAIVADALGVDGEAVREDPLLAEHDVGEWSGLRWPEIERDYGRSAECLRDWSHRPPGGETRREMLERARRWLAAPRDEAFSVVVGHGGLSRAFRGAYLELDEQALQSLETHVHGRLFVLESGEVREVIALGGPPPPESLLG